MLAQRVPPSAWSTSQSSQTVRSPSASMSTTARSERPMRRWISVVRPSSRPREMSRALRSPVEAGSIAYSAVTHPRPRPRIQAGTLSSTDAVQITRVRADRDQGAAVGGLDEPGQDLDGAELVVGAVRRRASRGA